MNGLKERMKTMNISMESRMKFIPTNQMERSIVVNFTLVFGSTMSILAAAGRLCWLVNLKNLQVIWYRRSKFWFFVLRFIHSTVFSIF